MNAKEFLKHKGIGSGTNITTGMVEGLLNEYATQGEGYHDVEEFYKDDPPQQPGVSEVLKELKQQTIDWLAGIAEYPDLDKFALQLTPERGVSEEEIQDRIEKWEDDYGRPSALSFEAGIEWLKDKL